MILETCKSTKSKKMQQKPVTSSVNILADEKQPTPDHGKSLPLRSVCNFGVRLSVSDSREERELIIDLVD